MRTLLLCPVRNLTSTTECLFSNGKTPLPGRAFDYGMSVPKRKDTIADAPRNLPVASFFVDGRRAR